MTNNLIILKCPKCGQPIYSNTIMCPKCKFNINDFIKDSKKLIPYCRKLISSYRYREAIDLYKIASRNNNSDAMYEYGLLYLNGIGVQKNYGHLMYCMSKSAELRNQKAILFLMNSVLNNESYILNYNIDLKQLFNMLNESNQRTFVDTCEDEEILSQIGIDEIETDTIGEIEIKNGDLIYEEFDTSYLEQEDNVVEKVFLDENIMLTKVIQQMEKQIDELGSRMTFSEHNSFGDNEFMYKYSVNEANKYRKTDIDKLNDMKVQPYFGRMFFDKNRNYYVGKEAWFDNESNIRIISWYSNVGNFYYSNAEVLKYDNEIYNLEEKRQISIENSQLMSVNVIYGNADRITANSDSFLLELIAKRHSDNEYKSIVASIQSNQNDIIRCDSQKNIIVQGCAGSGKTMILLHRIKYLIGNNIKKNNSMLVITPNEKFNNFIAPVVKDLNLYNIKIKTIEDFYIYILDSYYEKNHGKANAEKNKFSQLFTKNKAIKFGFNVLKLEDDSLLDKEIVNYYYSNDFFNSVMSLKQCAIKNITDYKIKKSIKNANLDILYFILKDNKKIIPNYNHCNSKIHKCELYALSLFLYRSCGHYIYNHKNKFSHKINISDMLFIDEAQNLSSNELVLIKAITGEKSIINLFGDINQNTLDYGISNWEELSKKIGDFNVYLLDKNYRNSKQIVNYTNKQCHTNMIPVGYETEEVMAISKDELNAQLEADFNESKVIISKEPSKFKNWKNKIDVYSLNDAKGLEFQSTYVDVTNMTDNEKYIAFTRALNKLTIIE